MLPSPGPLYDGAAHRTVHVLTGPPSGGVEVRSLDRCESLVVSVMVRFFESFFFTDAPITSSDEGALTSWPAAARNASPGLSCTEPIGRAKVGTLWPAISDGPLFCVTTMTGPAASAGVSPQPPQVSTLRLADVSSTYVSSASPCEPICTCMSSPRLRSWLPPRRPVEMSPSFTGWSLTLVTPND